MTVALVLFSVAVSNVGAQEASDKPLIEMMYVVKNAPAAQVAAILEAFMAKARGVSVVADPTANVVLIRAPRDATDRIQGILKELDRTPHMIAIEAWLVDGDAEATKAFQLAPQGEDPLEQMRKLESQGQLQVVNHVRLSTLDNLPAFAQLGERTPTVRSVTNTQGGLRGGGPRPTGAGTALRSYSYDSLGTLVRVTPRVSGESSITLAVEIEKSRLDPTAAADPESSPPPTIVTSTVQTTVRLADGVAMLLNGVRSGENGKPAISLVILRAKILDPR